jgi:hypothetical protein
VCDRYLVRQQNRQKGQAIRRSKLTNFVSTVGYFTQLVSGRTLTALAIFCCTFGVIGIFTIGLVTKVPPRIILCCDAM